MLRRREIENYLPQNVLRAWVHSRPGKRKRGKRRKRIFEAFLLLSPRQRHHFDMKLGFAALAHDAPAYGALYADLQDAQVEALTRGFGTKIGELFDEEPAERDLRRDGGWDEMNPVVQSLIEAAR